MVRERSGKVPTAKYLNKKQDKVRLTFNFWLWHSLFDNGSNFSFHFLDNDKQMAIAFTFSFIKNKFASPDHL